MPPKPPRSDVALAIVAAITLIAGGLIRKDGEVPVVGYVLAALACAPLAWRRTAPLAVLLAAFAGVLACLPVLHPYDTAVFVVMVALYTVAVEGGRRRSIVVGIGTACVLV